MGAPVHSREGRSGPSATAVSAVVALDPLELYAAAIDTSDYVARVAPLARALVPDAGDLLDVGAGGGQLGRSLRAPGRRWAAVEPSASMRARLSRLAAAPEIFDSGWEAAGIASHAFDTVLAATMPATMEHPGDFLARCRAWSRRTVIWVVPAQNGPRGLCFAGCLPAEWHGEDETPGFEVTLRGLAPSDRPQHIAFADWTFSAVVSDIEEIAVFLAGRLGWTASDERRPKLLSHLLKQSRPEPGGYRLEIPRRSCVMVWRA